MSMLAVPTPTQSVPVVHIDKASRRGRKCTILPFRRRVLSTKRETPSTVVVVQQTRLNVESQLGLVDKIASWFERKWGLPIGMEHDDMVHIGVIGLLKAWHRFDPTRGCSIETFAGYAIRGAIIRQLKELWTALNHEAPPSDEEMESPWLPPERGVLCREVIDFVGNLGVAEQALVYGCIADETYSSLARKLDIPITTALRRHLKALRKVRQAAGSRYDPERAAAT